MKIAVTAASGKLGTSIINALLAFNAKEDIIALARTPERATKLGVEVRGGDYEGINKGECNNPSDYEKAAGRPHQSWDDFFSHIDV